MQLGQRSARQPHVVFRANAAPEIGGGHVTRCLGLANALCERGWRCTFIVNREAAETVPALAETSHCCASVRALEDPGVDICAALDAGQVDLAVIDGYAFAAPAERRWRTLARRIMAIDDLADRSHDCDLLLDQTLGRTPNDYRAYVPEGCRLLLGPAYALLRPEFRRARAEALRCRAEPPGRRVLVSLGATDPGNAADRVLEGLAGVDCEAIEIVVGAASSHRTAIEDKAARLGARVTVAPKDMTEPMLRADLAIAAGGTTSWERCCLGLPSIVLVVADNQRLNAERLAASGAAVSLGKASEITPEQIASAAANLLNDAGQRRSMSRAGAAVCDGLGVARTVLTLEPVRADDGTPVHLRPARLDDANRLYEWQQAPGARQYARVPEPLSWDEHCDWLARKLYDPGSTLCIVEHGARPVGMVRLDDLTEAGGRHAYEVSVLIEAAEQNRGIGRAALSALRWLTMPDSRLVAAIHGCNKASLALFERAGYQTVDRSAPFWRLELDSDAPRRAELCPYAQH